MSGAWDRFWADDRQTGGGGCLPSADNRIEQVQAEAWRAFAVELPKHARVLDLGTGDGRVMRWMIEARVTLPSDPEAAATRGVDEYDLVTPASQQIVDMPRLPTRFDRDDCRLLLRPEQ